MTKPCRRCGQPVKNENDYDVFEGMHWLCFHLEFEHGDYDVDEPCDDPSCPWNRISGKSEEIIFQQSTLKLLASDIKTGIFMDLVETETTYLPSGKFHVHIMDPMIRTEDFYIWIEKDEIEKLHDEIPKLLESKTDFCEIHSMSPHDMIIRFEKADSLGHFLVSYEREIQRLIANVGFKSSMKNGFIMEYQSLFDFQKKLTWLCERLA